MARMMADGYLEGNMMQTQLNLHVAFKRNEQFPNKKVISYMEDDTRHVYTYREFQERVRRCASMLMSLGVKRGQRVGTFGYNHYQHLELYFAIPLIGAVLHTLNFRLFAEQIAYIVNHAEDVVIFTEGSLVNLLEPLHKAGRLPTVKHFVLMGHRQAKTSLAPFAYYETLIAAASPNFTFDENLPENAALGLCYTSGTTGNPKGVLYSHRSTMLSAVGAIFPQVYPLSDFDTLLCIVPMFHANAWGFPFIAVMQGTDIILPGKDLTPARLAHHLTSHPVTFTCGVPTIWLTVYDELKKMQEKGARFNLSGVRILSSGFACPDFLMRNYEKDFGVKMVQAWGMTELSPFGSIARLQPHHFALPEDEQMRLRLVQGTPQPLTQIRLVDDEGRPVPKDNRSVGNIQIRGPYVVSRYFRDEGGAASFTPDGWLRTGDVAVWDAESYMRLVDRSKDLIKSGGEWISSVELEHHIAAHPAVRDAAVVGVPHPRFQERPLALVVLREGQSVTKQELLKMLESKVAKWWIPDDLKFVTSLPKTSVGKPDKKAMRAAHENHYMKERPRAAL